MHIDDQLGLTVIFEGLEAPGLACLLNHVRSFACEMFRSTTEVAANFALFQQYVGQTQSTDLAIDLNRLFKQELI